MAVIAPACAASRWIRPGAAPELIQRLRAEVEKAPDGRLTDKELSSLAIDPSTARRQFKRYYGMTFQAYHRARRMGLALREVRRGEPVEEARNGSGFGSESGFREAFTKIFGDPPTTAKRRDCLFAERLTTPLGTMLAVADDDGLRLLEFGDRRALERELPLLRERLGKSVVPGEHPHLTAIRTQLADYFAGKNLEFDIPLAPVGSEFQLKAWEVLRSIPIGETRSYSWMAERLGDPGARRAVGRANGMNMMSIIIPCHRVIRADGTLCGYGGGLWRKKWLLEHERKVKCAPRRTRTSDRRIRNPMLYPAELWAPCLRVVRTRELSLPISLGTSGSTVTMAELVATAKTFGGRAGRRIHGR